MTTLPPYGEPFGGLPELRHVQDIEAFEGPILSELRAHEGSTIYLEKWCAHDIGNGVTRTLIVRSEQRALAEYLALRRSMLSLFTDPNDGVGFLVDYVGGQRSAVCLVAVAALPPVYLPSEDAYHDPDLRPSYAESQQMFLLDGEWDARLLANLEKLYKNAYAFTWFTSVNAPGPGIPPNLLEYKLNSGWTYGRVNRSLQLGVPRPQRARSTGVAAASPGVLTLSAPSQVASLVSRAIVASARPDVRAAYHALHSWSRAKMDRANDVVPEDAYTAIRRLADLLYVDMSKVLPPAMVANQSHDPPRLLAAAKLVASYFVHLRKLARPSEPNVAFVAPGLDLTGDDSIDIEPDSDDDIEFDADDPF